MTIDSMKSAIMSVMKPTRIAKTKRPTISMTAKMTFSLALLKSPVPPAAKTWKVSHIASQSFMSLPGVAHCHNAPRTSMLPNVTAMSTYSMPLGSDAMSDSSLYCSRMYSRSVASQSRSSIERPRTAASVSLMASAGIANSLKSSAAALGVTDAATGEVARCGAGFAAGRLPG